MPVPPDFDVYGDGDEHTHEIVCPACRGVNAHPPLLKNDCEDCQGTGFITHPRDEGSKPATLHDLDDLYLDQMHGMYGSDHAPSDPVPVDADD